MKIVDVNLLLYAVNSDSARHDAARAWLEDLLNGDETVGFPWAVLLGFLRVATNPRALARPIETPAALAQVDEWLTLEDAHLAALAICHDAVLCSSDLDFGRFKGLRWENPLS